MFVRSVIVAFTILMPALPLPAYVKNGREVHESWKMTCYPKNRMPYTVMSYGAKNKLVAGWGEDDTEYTVISNTAEKSGFRIVAVLADKSEYSHKRLSVLFSHKTGTIDFMDLPGNTVYCSRATPISRD